jgi:hypothetical protein
MTTYQFNSERISNEHQQLQFKLELLLKYSFLLLVGQLLMTRNYNTHFIWQLLVNTTNQKSQLSTLNATQRRHNTSLHSIEKFFETGERLYYYVKFSQSL